MMYNVAIIGAGPAGIFSALEIVKLKPDWKVVLIEKGDKMEYWLVNGIVSDGINPEPRRVDIKVKEGKIAEIGTYSGGKKIDVNGLEKPLLVDVKALYEAEHLVAGHILCLDRVELELVNFDIK